MDTQTEQERRAFLKVPITLVIINMVDTPNFCGVLTLLKIGGHDKEILLSPTEFKALAFRVAREVYCDCHELSVDQVKTLYATNVPIITSEGKPFFMTYYENFLSKINEKRNIIDPASGWKPTD